MKTVDKNEHTGKYGMQELVEIMHILRAPDGCPWDMEQTHKSIRNNFLEETYEAVDAIDNTDASALCEELGDVLMQVVFHSVIAEENGEFSFEDVVNQVSEKLIYRHPHVFSNTVAKTCEKVLENWDVLKQNEKNQSTYAETLKSVPKAFPALMRTAKVQKRAAKAGFVISGEEATENIKNILACEKADIGKLLFNVVALAKSQKTDSEEALAKETEEFIKRFSDGEDGNRKLQKNID